MFKKILVLLGLCLLVSCGQDGESKTKSEKKPSPRLDTRQIATRISFSCEEKSCPNSYALVVKNNASNFVNSSSVCSGFFISKLDIITSRECMGEYIYKCATEVAVKDINGNTAMCERITHGFVNSKNEEDLFVHIRLKEELDVDPVKFSKDTFKADKYYSRWNVERTYENDSYILGKTKNCRMTVNNVRFPVQQNGEQRDIVLTNCPPSPESIGSALLNDKNEVVGMVTGPINEDSSFDYLMGSRKGRKLISATPYTCMAFQRPDLFKNISLSDYQSKLCETSVDDSYSYFYNFVLSRIFLSVGQIANSKIVIDDSDTNNTRFVKISHPECLSDVRDVDLFKSCDFYPTLTSDYEIYRSKVNRCQSSARLAFSASLFTEGLYEVTVQNTLNKKVTQIYISSCGQ